MSDDTRTVHAEIVSTEFDWKVEVVRYDRAGKWWIEIVEGQQFLTAKSRRQISVDGAATYVRNMRDSFRQRGSSIVVTHHAGRLGGAVFDRKVTA